MSLKEILKRKVPYDPVTAPVPGIDPKQWADSINKYKNAGDPMPKREPPKEEIIFKLPGIRLVRRIRAK